jgi:hypothetical protein
VFRLGPDQITLDNIQRLAALLRQVVVSSS